MLLLFHCLLLHPIDSKYSWNKNSSLDNLVLPSSISSSCKGDVMKCLLGKLQSFPLLTIVTQWLGRKTLLRQFQSVTGSCILCRLWLTSRHLSKLCSAFRIHFSDALLLLKIGKAAAQSRILGLFLGNTFSQKKRMHFWTFCPLSVNNQDSPHFQQQKMTDQSRKCAFLKKVEEWKGIWTKSMD